MYINNSVVKLADTSIEKNNAITATAICIYGSQVAMDHCNISENYAKSIFFLGKHRDANIAGIFIDPRSEVTMNEVTLEGNIADGNYGAIANFGTLNLNEGTIITKNTTRSYSAAGNSKSGVLDIQEGVHRFNNHDEHHPGNPVHSEGIINMGVT